MDEAIPIIPKEKPVVTSEPLNWHLTAEEIAAMNEAQLRQTLIEFNEKVRRLYEAQMLEIRRREEGDKRPVTSEDVNHILNPERID